MRRAVRPVSGGASETSVRSLAILCVSGAIAGGRKAEQVIDMIDDDTDMLSIDRAKVGIAPVLERSLGYAQIVCSFPCCPERAFTKSVCVHGDTLSRCQVPAVPGGLQVSSRQGNTLMGSHEDGRLRDDTPFNHARRAWFLTGPGDPWHREMRQRESRPGSMSGAAHLVMDPAPILSGSRGSRGVLACL